MAFDNKLYGKCRKISNNHIQKHGFLVSRIFGRLAETFGAEYSADLAETFGRIFGFGRTLFSVISHAVENKCFYEINFHYRFDASAEKFFQNLLRS